MTLLNGRSSESPRLRTRPAFTFSVAINGVTSMKIRTSARGLRAGGKRAVAVEQKDALAALLERGDFLRQPDDRFRFHQARIAALVQGAEEQHGVLFAILGKVGRQFPRQRLGILEQAIRSCDPHRHARGGALPLQSADPLGEGRADVAVNGDHGSCLALDVVNYRLGGGRVALDNPFSEPRVHIDRVHRGRVAVGVRN